MVEVQRSLTVVARIEPDRLDELTSLLVGIGADVRGNEVIPLSLLGTIHFARFVILPEAVDLEGTLIPPTLIFSTNFDGSKKRHLESLVDLTGAGLDQIFSHCEGYPESGQRTSKARLAYLRKSSVRTQAFYVNTVGRTVQQVADEARLRREIEGFLDERDWTNEDAESVHRKIGEFVRADETLSWALERPSSDLGLRLWRGFKVGLLVLLGLAGVGLGVLLPVLGILALLLLVLFLLVLRVFEVFNYPENIRPSSKRLEENESDEDLRLQNELTAYGDLQKGLFRRLLVRVLFWVLNFGARNIFYRGQLAGVDTIHFARWTMIDRGRRVFFFTNYDGSLDSYNNDFVDRIAFGLNEAFGSGNGWPLTFLILFRGANDEQAFKFYLRNHQIHTLVWYVAPAYDGVTAVNAIRNSKIRAGVARSLRGRRAQEWLRLL